MRILLIIFLFFELSLSAQHSEPQTITALRIDKSIKFDGILNEKEWQEAKHISNFTQRDLDYGKAITEKTEVAVLYDKNTLYIGVWCYQKDVSTIVAKNMTRDFYYWNEDNFQVIISPYNDNRTGYLFVTNPIGARADIQVYGGEDGNRDWNGVWDVKTQITDKGWFAEIYIPFSTLQFKKTNTYNWAINFERDIASENEQALWQGWSRDYSIYSLANAGHLVGIENISYAKKFEFKPYALAGIEYNRDNEKTNYPIKAGGDLNISLSPTLKLNLTSFTDFAQVESDRIPVNLSRFSVFYPEKRQFFLEGSDKFSYYLGDRNSAFYTRQLGVEDGQQVPIIAGARLFGKVGKENIGFLNIQEGKTDSTLSVNNTVFRYKHDVGKQSYVGGIITNKIDKNHTNQVVGVDAAYETSDFLHKKNLVVAAKFTSSMQDYKYNKNAYTYRFYVDYPNDLIDNFMAVASMTDDFNPELGYIRRKNYNSYSWYFRLMPRLFTSYGVKRLLLKPWGFSAYYTKNTGELESFYNETRPLGAIFKSGERFELNFIQNYDRIDNTFYLTDKLNIPVGKYTMYKYDIQFETFHGRRLWAEFDYSFGDFYTGNIQTMESTFGINVNKHFNIYNTYIFNNVKLPEGNINTNELALYLNYSFTPKMFLIWFTQYNDLENIMIYNIRFHWIPKVGSDFYLVYNIGYDEPIKQVEILKPKTTNAIIKLVYRFVF